MRYSNKGDNDFMNDEEINNMPRPYIDNQN